MWVTAERYSAGFDAELLGDVKQWVATAWPLKR